MADIPCPANEGPHGAVSGVHACFVARAGILRGRRPVVAAA